MAQLALLDRSGVAVLARGLRHSRPEVAELCRRKLADLVDSWRSQPSSTSSAQIAHLAACLAEEIDALPPASQRFAGNLATEFLLWPLDERRVQVTRVVMHCELVLRVGLRADVVAEIPNDKPIPKLTNSVAARNSSLTRPVQEPEFAWTDNPLAGGGVPIDPIDVPATPPILENYELEAPNRFIPDTGVVGLPENPSQVPSMFGATPAQPVLDSQVRPPEKLSPLRCQTSPGRGSTISRC